MRYAEIIAEDASASFPDRVRDRASQLFAYAKGYDPEVFTDAGIAKMRNAVSLLITRQPKIYRLITAPPSFITGLKPGDALSHSKRYGVASWTTDFSQIDIQSLHIEDAWTGYADDQGDQNPLFAFAAASTAQTVDMAATICQRLEMPWENEVAVLQNKPCRFLGVFEVNEDGPLKLGKQVRPDLVGATMRY